MNGIPDADEILAFLVHKAGGKVEIHAREFLELRTRLRAYIGGLEVFTVQDPPMIVMKLHDPAAPIQETATVVDVLALPDRSK